MSKAVYVGLAAVALWGAGANAYAASPVVAAEYHLWRPGWYFETDVTTSPNGVAIFHWDTFDTGVRDGGVAVIKNAGELYGASGVTTAALNGDWSKIAIGRELQVSDPREPEREFVDDVEKVAREIGVQPEEVIAALYDDGFVGISLVSQPVIVDLETGAETPLAVAGGDFLYWLNDDELVIGRMVWGVEGGSMEAIKYDVRNGERETFAWEDVEPLLNVRFTVGVNGLPRPDYLRPPTPPRIGATCRCRADTNPNWRSRRRPSPYRHAGGNSKTTKGRYIGCRRLTGLRLRSPPVPRWRRTTTAFGY